MAQPFLKRNLDHIQKRLPHSSAFFAEGWEPRKLGAGLAFETRVHSDSVRPGTLLQLSELIDLHKAGGPFQPFLA